MPDGQMLTRCDAVDQVQIGNQIPQERRCDRMNGHQGQHAAQVLDSDDNPITHHWTTRG